VRRQTLTILALLFAFGSAGCDRPEEPPPPARVTTLRIVHGPELRAYMSTMKERFSLSTPTLPDGARLAVELISELGVPAARKLASGELKAEAWLAPSSSLVNFTNASIHGLGARQVDCVRLFGSPIVLATRPEHLEYFNTRGQEFSWQELYETKFAPIVGETPDRSYLAYSHGNPDASTAGLEALLQLAWFARSGHDAVTVEALRSEPLRTKLREYESRVSGYSMSDAFLLERTALSGSKRIRFTITSEQQLALFNQSRSEPGAPLVGLYPAEGSIWQDYHLCISEADWVTPAHQAGLRLLAKLLAGEQAQREVQERGFRPFMVEAAQPTSPTSARGVNLQHPRTSVAPVAGEVVKELLSTWGDLMRPSAVALVLDGSGSMEGEPLSFGKEHFRNLLARAPSHDLKALVSFSSEPRVEAPFTPDSASIIPLLDRIQPIGGSAVYDGIATAIELMTSPELNRYRKAIVLLTDGEDKNSSLGLQALLDLVNSKLTRYDINLMIIGVSREGVSYADLQKVARAANGLFREAPPTRLGGVFQEVFKSL